MHQHPDRVIIDYPGFIESFAESAIPARLNRDNGRLGDHHEDVTRGCPDARTNIACDVYHRAMKQLDPHAWAREVAGMRAITEAVSA